MAIQNCTDTLVGQLLTVFSEDTDLVASICEAGCNTLEGCKTDGSLYQISALAQSTADAQNTANIAINTSFLLTSGYLVFMMQLGFAM